MNCFKNILNEARLAKGDIAGGTLFIAAIMVGLIGFGVSLTSGIIPPAPTKTGVAVTIVPPNPSPGLNNLQLYTFGYTTPVPTVPPTPTTPQLPTPTPQQGGVCAPDTGGSQRTCECVPGEWDFVFCKENPCLGDHDIFADSIAGRLNFPPFNVPADYTCSYTPASPLHNQKKLEPNCVHVCFGKPVIYLYPLVATLVNVKLTIPGRIYISDPLYPTGGWKNVLAYPDGKLIYQSKTYHELYYESEVEKAYTPENGIVIPTAHLKSKLTEITTKLGLIKPEQSEFLDYWLPKLNKLNSPYILFSILDSAEKERVDHVDISPAPDTKIEFLVYFKAQKSSTTILKPLSLPQTPPARVGFTSVEWGGTIAN